MDFNEFKEEVKERIKDFLPDEYENANVIINDVIKNNDTHLSGLVIRNDESGIAPTIYLEDFYNKYQGGESMDYILDHISFIYQEAMENGLDIDTKEAVQSITDYEETKGKIVPRVVNLESNEERLKGMPHTKMGDLAVTYHVALGRNEGGEMSVAISNEMFNRYGVTVDELHEKACENMKEISPTSFETMVETLANLMIPGYEDMTPDEKADARQQFDMPDPGMYVLSNSSKSFGAAAILDTETMDKIEAEVGDFYILPSSVHETLIVPIRENMELSDLEAMVQEVNATQVAPNEVLSDHVYKYDSQNKEIYRADKEEEHFKEKEKRPSLKDRIEEKKKEVKEKDKETKTKTRTEVRE